MNFDARHYLVGFVMALLGVASFGALTHGTQPLNPDVSQTSIGVTICTSGWTGTVRPPTSFTTPLKNKLCAAQNCGDVTGYELDHRTPIELGGAPADPKNLWLQPYPEAHLKDTVENYLKRKVCANQMTLKDAQAKILNWKSVYTTMTSGFGAVEADESNAEDD